MTLNKNASKNPPNCRQYRQGDDGEMMNAESRDKYSKVAMVACGLVGLAALLPVVLHKVMPPGGSNLGEMIKWFLIMAITAGVWAIACILMLISVVLACRGRCGWLWPRLAVGLCIALPMAFYIWRWWPSQRSLVQASELGRKPYVALVLRLGYDVNEPMEYGLGFNPVSAPSRKGYTALTIAVLRQQQDMVQFLLERGADVNRPNGDNVTALQIAEASGNTDIVELLLRHGAVRRNIGQ